MVVYFPNIVICMISLLQTRTVPDTSCYMERNSKNVYKIELEEILSEGKPKQRLKCQQFIWEIIPGSTGREGSNKRGRARKLMES